MSPSENTGRNTHTHRAHTMNTDTRDAMHYRMCVRFHHDRKTDTHRVYLENRQTLEQLTLGRFATNAAALEYASEYAATMPSVFMGNKLERSVWRDS